mgnify:CR=1 FL=1
MILLDEFMKSEYNDLLDADLYLLVDGEKIRITEENSTPEFFKKYEDYEIVNIRPTIMPVEQEDIVEDDLTPEVDVHFNLGFLVELEKYVEESEDLKNGSNTDHKEIN